MNIKAQSGGVNPATFATGVSITAVAVSAGLAMIGVAGLIGWATPLTIAGSVALLIGVTASEVRASALLVDADRAARENPLKAVAAVLAFMALTAANVTAGHMGMTAIDNDAVNARRAPLEQGLAKAKADLETAKGDLAEFDHTTAELSNTRKAVALKGVDGKLSVKGDDKAARMALRTAIRAQAKASASALEDAETAALARSEARKPYSQRVMQASTALNGAQAKLDAVAGGLPEYMLWGFAAILELLKGVSVWLATGSKKRQGVTQIAPKEVAQMTDEELTEAASKAASMAAQCRHEANRRKKAAA